MSAPCFKKPSGLLKINFLPEQCRGYNPPAASTCYCVVFFPQALLWKFLFTFHVKIKLLLLWASSVLSFTHTHPFFCVGELPEGYNPTTPGCRCPGADISTCCLTNFKCIYRKRCSSFLMAKYYNFSSPPSLPVCGAVSRFPFIKHSCQAATILFVYKKTKVPMFQFVNVKVICCRHLQRLRGCHELSSSAKETKDPDRLKTRVDAHGDGAIRKWTPSYCANAER